MTGKAGQQAARTPNLDALAARGVRLRTADCSSPICTPARQTYTTGKYVSGHSVWNNTVGVPEAWPTLPKVMRAAGYNPYLIGKMHYKTGRNYGFTLLDKGAKREPSDDTEPKAKPSPGWSPSLASACRPGCFPTGAINWARSFYLSPARSRSTDFLISTSSGATPRSSF